MMSDFDRAYAAVKALPITVVRRLLAAAWIAYSLKSEPEARWALQFALRTGTISADTINAATAEAA